MGATLGGDDHSERLTRLETRMDATEQSVDRLRTWLGEFQGRVDSQHREVMNELRSLHTAQDQREGAREQTARIWKAAGIVAAIVAATSALGWLGQ